MSLTLLILNSTLAALFIVAGATKVVLDKHALLARDGMGWSEQYTPGAIKAIGAAELIGALGLVAPLLTGVARYLAPAAAAGLLVIMIGAIAVHRRRHEPVALPAVLAGLALVSCWLGILTHPLNLQ